MVWFVIKHMSNNFHNIQDTIFQKTNILFYCQDRAYDCATILSLWRSGVTVLVVDLTKFDIRLLKAIENVILQVERFHPTTYYEPIALAVVMDVEDPLCIDERVDIIILKGANCTDDLIKFKKTYQSFAGLPILLWFSNLCSIEIPDLIKISDGVVLELKNERREFLDQCQRALDFCEKYQKPVLYTKREFTHEYNHENFINRRVLESALQLANNYLHGILVEDTHNAEDVTKGIRALVTSLYSMEEMKQVDNKYYGFSPMLKQPLTPPYVVALSACLAAYECGASVLLVLTASGRSARWVACARPPCHVVAISKRPAAVRQMHLYRKILPLLYTEPRAVSWRKECQNRVRFGTTFALKIGLVSNGAKLVVLAPADEGCGFCSAFQIVSVPFKCS